MSDAKGEKKATAPKKTEKTTTPSKKTLTIAAFPKLVEVGRVVLLKAGKQKGSIASVVDIIDARRFLIDGPESGVPRRAARANEIHLTKFVLKYPRGCKTKTVREAWNKAGMMQRWSETNLYKKMEAAKKRAAVTDLDRFKLYVAKQRRNRLIKKHYKPLLKKARKEPVKKAPKKHKHAKGPYVKRT
jgi:large subunit ribosomal protein L14e